MKITLSVMIGLLLYMFWIYRLDDYPLSFHETIISDGYSYIINQARAENINLISLYDKIIYKNNLKPLSTYKPEYFFNIISNFPFLIIIRSLLIGNMQDKIFITFKYMNVAIFIAILTCLYFILKRLYGETMSMICLFFLIVSFPMLAVVRVSGRIYASISMLLLFCSLMYFMFFLKKNKVKDFVLLTIFSSLSFFNGLHSFAIILPLLLVFAILSLKDVLRIGIKNIIKYCVVFTLLFIIINMLLTLIITIYSHIGLIHYKDILTAKLKLYFLSSSYDLPRYTFKSIFNLFMSIYCRFCPSNHFDEFNYNFPTFTYMFTFFFVLGIYYCIKKYKLQYKIPIAIISTYVILVLLRRDNWPRYMINFYLGFCIIASVGVNNFYEYLKQKNFYALFIITVLLIGHTIITAYMFYGDNYAGFDGMADNCYGQDRAMEYIEKMEGDKIDNVPIVYGEWMNELIFAYSTRFKKTKYYYYGKRILCSKETYKHFKRKHIEYTGKIYFIFESFKMPSNHKIETRIDHPFLCFKQLFPDKKPEKIIDYPNGEHAIYVYSDE